MKTAGVDYFTITVYYTRILKKSKEILRNVRSSKKEQMP